MIFDFTYITKIYRIYYIANSFTTTSKMRKTLCALILVVIHIEIVYCLTCYTCNAHTSPTCTQSRNHKTQVCGQAAPGFKSVCSYIETYDGRSYNGEAGCQLANYHDSINTIKGKLCSSSAYINVNKCVVCEHNFCNSVYY